MKKMKFGLFAIVAISASTTWAQSTTVVPQAFENTNATAGLNSTLRDAPNSRTYQCVYAASELGDISNGSQITGITWRCYSTNAAWPAVDAHWSQYDIYLSTSNNAPGSLSTTFADNEGGDRVLCRTGALTIPANSFPAGSNPPANRFGYVINFSTPFTYNGGDICVTVRHTGNDTATNAFVDNATTYGTGVHGGYNTAYDATVMSFTYTGPLVAQFTFGSGGGYTASTSGTCPGQVTVNWSGAEPNKTHGLVFAKGIGNITIPVGNPCAGTQLGLNGQGTMLVDPPGFISTGGTGSGHITGNASQGACHGYVQWVTGGSCATSTVAQLP